MNNQSLFFKIIVWVILIVNVFYTVPSVFMTKELLDMSAGFNVTNFIFYLAAVVLLVENGTLIQSKLVYFMAISIVCIVIGFIFKIQHWYPASEILVFGLCSCLCVYLVHFVRKSSLAMLDYLKLVWVVLYVAFSLDSVFRYYFIKEWMVIRDLAFLTMLAYYTYIFTIRKSIPDSTE